MFISILSFSQKDPYSFKIRAYQSHEKSNRFVKVILYVRTRCRISLACILAWSLAKVFYDRAKARDGSIKLAAELLFIWLYTRYECPISCTYRLFYFHQLMQATCNAPRCTDFATPRHQIFVDAIDTTNLIRRERIRGTYAYSVSTANVYE